MRPAMIYLEDLEVGAETDFGSYKVTREEVLEFARKYDPQPFHLSDEEAAKTHFGRLSASGWHTAAMTMAVIARKVVGDRKSTRLNSSHLGISYAVFCLKKKKQTNAHAWCMPC